MKKISLRVFLRENPGANLKKITSRKDAE